MIGQAAGSMVSTHDLEANQAVIMDGEQFIVDNVDQTADHYVVTLVPTYGPAWPLEISAADYHEPLWEVK